MAEASCILVIEDNAVERKGLAVVLRQQGFSVITMEDAEKALVYLQTNPPPDLILLDMLFPVGAGDGWNFLTKRLENPSLAGVPVLITTAMSAANDAWANSLGAVGCLQKPFEIEDLIAAVRRHAK